MKKLFLLLAMLAAFTSCDMKHHKKTILHSYVSNDNGDIFYWYMFYGDNNTYYTYSSRLPMSDFTDISWNVSDVIPKQITNAEELEQTELEDTAVDDNTTEAVESSPEANNDSGADSSSGDSGGGDGGGD